MIFIKNLFLFFAFRRFNRNFWALVQLGHFDGGWFLPESRSTLGTVTGDRLRLNSQFRWLFWSFWSTVLFNDGNLLVLHLNFPILLNLRLVLVKLDLTISKSPTKDLEVIFFQLLEYGSAKI